MKIDITGTILTDAKSNRTEKEFIRRIKAYSKGLGHEFSDEFFKRIYKFANYIEKTGNGSHFSIRNAQRVVSACCKRRNFAEFFSIFKINYLDEPEERFAAFCENPNIINQIHSIYECYEKQQYEDSGPKEASRKE